ncbi:polysaccharide biosynthesis protein [uncultured Bacteroides sp.]|uniref:polysaccharide biosynthesis protein n=1 Tax=uncultured Bacteroides sp. TaxID=162156 RepID=UPI0026043041|nr:polysaccharide biosynthesis protein [uncultured Bacteroides sp.]
MRELNLGQLILVDQVESSLYDVQLELSDHWEGVDVRVLVADIANRSRMESIFGQYMPQLVFHAAAYKDISMLDEYPDEAVRTNVAGTKNVVDLSVKYRAAKCMMISTDCASVPLHVMGYSKRLAEMYVQGMSCVATSENSCTKLMVARFGNVYPHDPRSLMTMPEACQLLLTIGNWGENGGIYIFEEAQAEDLLPTNNEKISQLSVRFTDGGDVCRLIDVLTENSCVQNLENIIDEMKKIISKTAVSKIMV